MYDALPPDLRAAVAYYPHHIGMQALYKEVRRLGARAVTSELVARVEPHAPCKGCGGDMLRRRNPPETHASFRARDYCSRQCARKPPQRVEDTASA